MKQLRFSKIINVALIIALVVVVFVFILRVTRFGYIDTSGVLNDAVVLIDGVAVSSEKTKVSTGNHVVVVESKSKGSNVETITVGRLSSEKVSNPNNSDAQIAIKTLEGFKWGFDESNIRELSRDDNYLVGAISQGSISPFVLEYKDGWKVLYFNTGSYVSNRSLIPVSVLPKIEAIEAKYADR